MNVTKLNRSGLNVSRLNASLLNASGIGAIGCKGKATMEDKIMSSMVLWYDLAKQGATNESMAADPRLIDHSGNGHHATCYNFAWSGMSGVGGYDYQPVSANQFGGNGGKIEYNANHTKAIITNTGSSKHSFWQVSIAPGESITFKIKVTGITNSNLGIMCRTLTIREDGEYAITLTNEGTNNTWVGFSFLENYNNQACNITIEQLPLYPHALVSDGVDDYAVVEGLPILTKEKGYTVIAKRKWIITGLGAVCSKTRNNDGAFQLERVQGIVEYPNTSVSYNQYIPITVNNDDTIVYQTTYDYNGSTSLSTRDVLYTDFMSICSVTTEIYSRHSGIVLYSLLLFNRDLTTEEIEWVKTNLITE